MLRPRATQHAHRSALGVPPEPERPLLKGEAFRANVASPWREPYNIEKNSKSRERRDAVAQQTLEARVARLEQQISLLMGERTGESQPAADDWKQTVGVFRGDPIVGQMIEESRRMREDERRQARETMEEGPA